VKARALSVALFVGMVAFAGPAGAVPSLMGYSGHLVDDSNVPYTGQYDFVVGIYAAPSAGTLVFEETFASETVDAGYFYLLLANNEVGGGDDLELIFAAQDQLYLELEVDGTTLAPRQRLTAVPWALGNSSGGGGGTRLESITAASCADGEVLQYLSSSDTFYCDPDDVGAGGGGGDITGVSAGTGLTGGGTSADVTLDVDFGSTSSTVAEGDHEHPGADISSGTVAFGRLPTGITATTVAVGNHAHIFNAVVRTAAGDPNAVVQCGGSGKASGGGCWSIDAVKASNPVDAGGSAATDGEMSRGWYCGCSDASEDGACAITAYAICINE
jgi:hypothetical protein